MLEPAWIGKIEPVSRPTIRVALNTGRDSNKRLVDLRHPQENPQAAIAEDLLKRPRELLLEHRTDLDRRCDVDLLQLGGQGQRSVEVLGRDQVGGSAFALRRPGIQVDYAELASA